MSEHLSIRLLGGENSTADQFIPGGSVWHLSGENMEEEGVMLLPSPTQMYDAPMTTFWAEGMGRRIFQGFALDKREPQLGFQIWHGGSNSADDWRATDSLFRISWFYDRLSRLEFETEDGVRYLDMQLMKEPEPYSGDLTNGRDPHFQLDSAMLVKVACPNPLFQVDAEPLEQECSGSSGTMTFPLVNDSDTEMWPKWVVSSTNAGTKWTLPDYSLGCNEYLKADVHATRTWTSPSLLAGEHVVFDADGRNEFADSALSTNVWARCKGKLFYPIPPHTKVDVTVSYTNATVGDKCRFIPLPNYTRAWGVNGHKVVTP